MAEKFPIKEPSLDKAEDVFDMRNITTPESSPDKANEILLRLSRERMQRKDVRFSSKELGTVVGAWEYLSNDKRNLALFAFPEIAAALLSRLL